MWYRNENGDDRRPAEIDSTSSQVYVYVRRDIVRVEATEDAPAHYRWEEMKIPREMWAVCEKVFSHDGALEDVYAALAELAGMIVEG